MISSHHENTLLPLFNQLANGVPVDFSSFSVKSESVVYAMQDGLQDPGTPAKKKNVVVIPIQGVIMKYDYCGDMGMKTFASILDDLKADERVGAVVIAMDSGGGQASYLDTVCQKMREFAAEKPILVSVSGYCASAAYYISAPATGIYCNSELDMVGSIGTMCRLYKKNENSRSEYTTEAVYATKSTMKNHSYREFENGNPKPLQEEMDVLNDRFHSDMIESRPAIVPEALNGQHVYAPDAKKLGLIDGIMSFEEVIQLAMSLIK